jgi:hypothetical protein
VRKGGHRGHRDLELVEDYVGHRDEIDCNVYPNEESLQIVDFDFRKNHIDYRAQHRGE